MSKINFLIAFHQKEGTSAFVRLIDNLKSVSVVHQVEDRGWEPFDRHRCGPMKLRDQLHCISTIFSDVPIDMQSLNRIYTRTAIGPLADIPEAEAIGFKMRFRPPRAVPPGMYLPLIRKIPIHIYKRVFRKGMINLFLENNVKVFIAERKDVLRWALSVYHGDGTGRRGHLQFQENENHRARDMTRMKVDCERLERAVMAGLRLAKEKRELREDLLENGIEVHSFIYEDFCRDCAGSVRAFVKQLGLPTTDHEIEDAVERGTAFSKVHSHDISTFVVNHEEVLKRFGKYSL